MRSSPAPHRAASHPAACPTAPPRSPPRPAGAVEVHPPCAASVAAARGNGNLSIATVALSLGRLGLRLFPPVRLKRPADVVALLELPALAPADVALVAPGVHQLALSRHLARLSLGG